MWQQDIRYSLRILVRNPAFAAAAVLILALGIGANTAMFSTINAILLRKLPVENPDRLVTLWETNPGKGIDQSTVSAQTFNTWRDGSDAFEQMAVYGTDSVVLTGAGQPERVASAQVSANFFSLLGAHALWGRTFLSEESQSGDRVVVISHDMWQRRFNSDPTILNKTIILDKTGYVVIGILPPDFRFIDPADLWFLLPLDDPRQSCDACHFFTVLARLKGDKKLGQAQAEMDVLARRIAQQRPDTNTGVGIRIVRLQDYLVAGVRSSLLILFAAVIFVLLIACANVANLLLARTAARQKELAVRAALGAPRRRLVRQVFIESLLISLTGGILGLFLAFNCLRVVNALIPEGIVHSAIALDGRVLGFTLLLSLLTGTLFGLAPALQVLRMDLNDQLRHDTRGSTRGIRHARARSLLVISEIALSLTLLVGAGLMIKSFVLLQKVNPGFSSEDVLSARVFLAADNYPQAHQKAEFFQRVLQQLETLPGVQSVGAVTSLPLSGSSMNFRFSVEGQPESPGDLHQAQYRAISQNYFHTMGIPLLKGRDLTARDGPDTAGVVIINETMAHRLFPNQEPLGKRLRINYGKPAAREIIGVVRDVRHVRLDENPKPEMYVPYLQNPWPFMTLVIRSTVPASSLIPALRNEISSVDKDQPLDKIRTVNQILYESLAQPRLYMFLFSVFAVLAVILAALGVYSVMAYLVSQRTNEIGVRMALGAQPGAIHWLVVRQGMSYVLIGLGVGLIASLVLSRVLSNLLYGISPSDPITFVEVVFLLAGVALLACYIPARKATKVDSVMALRYE
jgi:predicted permease